MEPFSGINNSDYLLSFSGWLLSNINNYLIDRKSISSHFVSQLFIKVVFTIVKFKALGFCLMVRTR